MINVTAALTTQRHVQNQDIRDATVLLSARTQDIADHLREIYGIQLARLGLTLPKPEPFAERLEKDASSYLGHLSGTVYPFPLPQDATDDMFEGVISPIEAHLTSPHIGNVPEAIRWIRDDLPDLRVAGMLDQDISHLFISTSQSTALTSIMEPLNILQRGQSEFFDIGGIGGTALCVHVIRPSIMSLTARKAFEADLRAAPGGDSVISTWCAHDKTTTLRYSLAGRQVLLEGEVFFRSSWVNDPHTAPQTVQIAVHAGP